MKWSQTYSGDGGRSNAKRAARKAGVDVELVQAHGDGFRFPLPEAAAPAAKPAPANDDGLDIPANLRRQADPNKPAPRFVPPSERKLVMRKGPATKPKHREIAKSGDKVALVASLMRDPKGATVDDLCKATGWLPHTLRARISKNVKPLLKAGEAITRERLMRTTWYKIGKAA